MFAGKFAKQNNILSAAGPRGDRRRMKGAAAMPNIYQIKYADEKRFLGRNGMFTCAGIDLCRLGNTLTLTPITSKNNIGRAFIEVPTSQIDDLLIALRALKG